MHKPFLHVFQTLEFHLFRGRFLALCLKLILFNNTVFSQHGSTGLNPSTQGGRGKQFGLGIEWVCTRVHSEIFFFNKTNKQTKQKCEFHVFTGTLSVFLNSSRIVCHRFYKVLKLSSTSHKKTAGCFIICIWETRKVFLF